MNDLTISGGLSDGVAGSPGAKGGGIRSFGTLNLHNSTVSGNSATQRGGGISNRGRLNLDNSTLSVNKVSGDQGGGIYSCGTSVEIANSTLSANTAGSSGLANGGAIYSSCGTLTITNSTISDNNAGLGGGIWVVNIVVSLKNTIVANNTGGNCSGTITSNGQNLDSDNTCGLTHPTDLPSVDPLLGPLQDNGGPTQTHALLPGSSAIDAGDDGAAPATDQRGVSRPQGAASDIGAFELAP